jgi:glycosidase
MKIRVKWYSIFVVALILTGCLGETPTPTQEPNLPEPSATVLPPTAVPSPTLEPTLIPAADWWNDAVFYEVFVRSFKDSDGDGKGDINGLIEKLDYLNDGDPATTTDLGVTGLWLMPINESPSYHGYDVVDYYSVEQDYGTIEDFKRLIVEAHQRGIKVIIDLVLNHSGSDHPWFKAAEAGDSKYRDWYVWSDTKPDYKGPWGQEVWYRSGDAYYYAVFWSEMPDLNLQNPEVTAEIEKITSFWLNDMNVDGFRLDAIIHYVENGAMQKNTDATHAWLQDFNQYYKSIEPQAFTVGEAWTDTSEVLDYIGDEVDISFQFDLADAMVSAANGPLASGPMQQWKTILQSFPEGQYGVFLTNHDQNRVMTQVRAVEDAKVAATMLLTAPGVPFIYYGEEIGMTGEKPDEHIRRPMQWNGDSLSVGFSDVSPWISPSGDYKEVNVALQTDDPESLLSHYRSLIQLRTTHAAMRTGDTLLVDAGTQRLYAMLRYNDEEAFLILVNVHPKPLTADLYSLSLESGPFKGAVNAASVFGLENPSAPEINAAGGFSGYIPFQEIPAKSSVIIRLAP